MTSCYNVFDVLQGAASAWSIHSLTIFEDAEPPVVLDGDTIFTTASQQSASVRLVAAASTAAIGAAASQGAQSGAGGVQSDAAGLEATLRHSGMAGSRSQTPSRFSGEPAAAMRALMQTLETVRHPRACDLVWRTCDLVRRGCELAGAQVETMTSRPVRLICHQQSSASSSATCMT